MFIKKNFFFFFLLSSISYSQQNFNFSGTVKSRNKFLPDVIIELNFKKGSDYAISNSNGSYKFSNQNYKLNDTLFIRVSNPIYKEFKQSIILTNETIILDIDLEFSNIEQLKEVEIKSDYKTRHFAGKSIYKINKNDFIKNATAADVLSKIPSIFYNKNSNETIVNGTLVGTVFIDGIRVKGNEIGQLNVFEIDKVEVINNPSSIYGVDFIGAIVNISSKKNNSQFLKGNIDISSGLLNNLNSIGLNFSFKKGFFYINTNASFFKENQNSSLEINRINKSEIFEQKSSTIATNNFNNFNTILGFKFSKKLDLTVDSYSGGYQLNDFGNGFTFINNSLKNNFVNANNINNRDSEVASVLKYKIFKNKTLNVKHTYLLENSMNINEFDQFLVNVGSQSKANSFNINYGLSDVKFLKNTNSIIFDLKYIHRLFNFTDSDFYINQNIFNATIDVTNQWTEKLSSEASFTYENSINKNDFFLKKYNLFLPSFNFLYSFEKSIDLNAGYSRRLLRPSPADLNNKLILSSPGVGYQGNEDLDQQIRSYFFISLNKSYKLDVIGFKIYNVSINDFISDVYKNQGIILIRTLDNVAKFYSTGFNFSFSTIILKKINLNLDSGLNYNVIENNAVENIINKNNGFTFNGSFYLDANFFKNKLAISLSGFQEGPNYTLLAKRVIYPSFRLSISTNIFKEKVKLSLYANNLLGNNFTGFNDKSATNNFSQSFITRNNKTNIQVSLSYNFGKTFEDIEVNKIENEDIRK